MSLLGPSFFFFKLENTGHEQNTYAHINTQTTVCQWLWIAAVARGVSAPSHAKDCNGVHLEQVAFTVLFTFIWDVHQVRGFHLHTHTHTHARTQCHQYECIYNTDKSCYVYSVFSLQFALLFPTYLWNLFEKLIRTLDVTSSLACPNHFTVMEIQGGVVSLCDLGPTVKPDKCFHFVIMGYFV